MTYEVLAVCYGELHATKKALFHNYPGYGEPDRPASLAYYFWVLRDGGRTILVDTGFDPRSAARRGRTCRRAPLDALTDLGIAPGDVSTVVVTHLHYDHVGNLAAFPHAELIVPAAEMAFWTGPLATRPQFAMHVDANTIVALEHATADGRVRLTDGDEEILDGITAISVGGHSPGQQVTVVSSAVGPVVLTSDAVHLYEELELDRPFAIIHDLERMYTAYDRVRQLAGEPGAVVIPGHDPEVLARHGGGATTVAVRIA
jgi:glyoxylase-like metal-dependent hydrolase (beta-lactamase superfamily II)